MRYWLQATTEQLYREEMINEFMQNEPDIEIQMDGTDPANYNEATWLLFPAARPGRVLEVQPDAPADAEGKHHALPGRGADLPDQRLSGLHVLNGVNMIDGHLYGFYPVGKTSATRLYMNDELFDKAGITEAPKTWSDFRNVAKQLTEAGGGQSYGLILGGTSPWDYTGLVGSLAYTAGPMASGNSEAENFDWTKGELTIASDYMVAALQLCMDIAEDGSLFPGYSTISHTESRAGLPSGWAGMFLGGWWDAGAYNTQFPEFSYSVAPPPEFDGGRLGYNLGTSQIERVYVAKGSEVTDAINRFLLFKFGPVYQKGWARNGWFTTLPEANDESNIKDPIIQTIFKIAEDIRTSPNPVARNVEQAKVSVERKELHPNWGELLGGVFSASSAWRTMWSKRKVHRRPPRRARAGDQLPAG